MRRPSDARERAVVDDVPGVPRDAEVGAQRVGLAVDRVQGVVPHPVAHRGDDGDERRADHDERAAAPAEGQHRPHQERPRQVELLLDRQRPEVAERAADGVGARGLAGPVGVVEGDRRDARPARRVRRRRDQEPQRDRHEHADHDHRVQAQRPPDVEVLQAEAAVHAELAQQQRGDQEAAEHEEQVDPEPRAVATQPVGREAGVEQHHGRDADGAQAVEPRLVGEGRGRRRVVGRRARDGGAGLGRADLRHAEETRVPAELGWCTRSPFIPSER